MSQERSEQRCFVFTERERLYDRISHARFIALINQPDVEVHEVKVDSNSFGEYLFVTASCRVGGSQQMFTFWGLGYHDQRERWILDSWQWYESNRSNETRLALSKRAVLNTIREREDFARASNTNEPQSERAKLYEMLADLTDEDGALTELEDLGWMFLGDDEGE